MIALTLANLVTSLRIRIIGIFSQAGRINKNVHICWNEIKNFQTIPNYLFSFGDSS